MALPTQSIMRFNTQTNDRLKKVHSFLIREPPAYQYTESPEF